MAKIASSPATKPTHQAIAERARQIYEQSGCIPGRDEENWLRAEAELTASRQQIAAKDAAKTAVTKPAETKPTVTKPAATKSQPKPAKNTHSTYA